VQHLGEGLGRGSPVKALSRGVVVGGHERTEAGVRQVGEIGFARDKAAHAADGVLDAAFLPRRVRVAEEGLNAEPVKLVMSGELGAVIEGNGSAQVKRQRGEDRAEVTGDAVGLLVGWPHGDEQARLPLVHGQHGLAVFGEQHQVGFPMAGRLAVGGIGRAFRQGNPAFDEADGATAFAATTAALALGPRQVVTPAIVLVAGDLRVDEAVDGLVADDLAAALTGEPRV
jgi:hypothetical protein